LRGAIAKATTYAPEAAVAAAPTLPGGGRRTDRHVLSHGVNVSEAAFERIARADRGTAGIGVHQIDRLHGRLMKCSGIWWQRD